ncbi:tRNA (adenosine(37)-N6)-threonylcarbamoyltransferase complex dimerization subunit type 1 TsaB [Phaeobacter sp.]|uniref:tRNA (adenosine(37)-N6)-threonylcarbamoyltransferase complex dimerization subunit type 1 TsaB n=1 Tax=Phaeobacter sp. TaxID=1902409 RepID=UPI0025E6B38B|nr:tRNA (adenosine(37)-N6)-threonylcarbamoyltransferase complex dimerization subunit type 1 TsaB [Phaeobacter sp.]
MPSEPLVLGFDTSAAHCAAALLRGHDIIASRAETMARGQAERLMPLLEETLADGGAEWSDLTALGVGVGPGNFTGIRIAVSAARGLALGLGIPAVGVDGFVSREQDGVLPAVPAPRDQVYVCLPGSDPQLLPLSDAEAIAAARNTPLVTDCAPADLASQIARIAASRYQQDMPPPAPLYVRAADAAPSKDQPPQLIEG